MGDGDDTAVRGGADAPMPGRFAMGAGWAAYRGPTDTGAPHRHAAFQIALGNGRAVEIVDEAGVRHRSHALVVAPMVEHRLLAASDVTTFFVEPRCRLAGRLRHDHGRGVSSAPELQGLRLADVGTEIDGAEPAARAALDPRLMHALDVLARADLPLSVVAAEVGLSVQRLRDLAARELGMPLVRWRMWSRLRRAAEGLRAGQTLAGAAAGAGFADQAHLTRAFRQMMGATPATVLPLLRAQPLAPT